MSCPRWHFPSRAPDARLHPPPRTRAAPPPGIFNPVMEAVGGGWWRMLRIPSSVLVGMAGGMEALLETTGIDLFRLLGPAALTRKEALKTATTDTHDITRARELL
eukprot:gene9846-5623_t